MSHNSGVYVIEHRASGKVYVGSTVNFRKRWAEHRRLLGLGTHHSSKLQRAWSKYEVDAFIFKVLEPISEPDQLCIREQVWIDFLDSVKRGFNICPSARGRLGIPHTAESRQKMSRAAKGREITASTRAAISLAHKGRIKSAMECENISKGKKGAVFSMEHLKNLSISHLGKGNALKTHCPKGHPYSGENLYTTSLGHRQCRACIRARKQVG